MATLTERIIGTITFNRGMLKEVAESDDATQQAWMLIFLSLIIGAALQGLAAFLNSNAMGIFSFFLQDQEGIAALIGVFIAYLVLYFVVIYVWAAILAFVGRGFGGKLSTAECIRLIGFTFAVIFLIPSSLLNFLGAAILPDLVRTIGLIGILFLLWGLAAFVYGYSIGSDLSIVMSIIAVIIAAVLALILAGIVVFIIALILVAVLLAAFASSAQTSTILFL